jgi:hypothetical protein
MARYHVAIPLQVMVHAESESEAREIALKAVTVDVAVAELERGPGSVQVSLDLRDRSRWQTDENWPHPYCRLCGFSVRLAGDDAHEVQSGELHTSERCRSLR